jgi:hypothetical protein
VTTKTFGYIVGGDDKYYTNLMRSLKSLEERVKDKYEVLIIDMDGRFYADESNIKVVNESVNKIDNDGDELNRNWLQPHVWAKRYELYKHVETDYCFYMDVDTVLINDRTDELIDESEDQFMLAQHWWVPTLNSFLSNVRVDLSKVRPFLPPTGTEYFYGASGCFLFKKESHDHIFKKYQEIYDEIHGDGSAPMNVTDELILCLSFNQFDDWKFTSGALNHTAHPKSMPLIKENGIWMGKNSYEDEYKPVFVFHSSYEYLHTLESEYLEEIKKEMYWEEYHP